MDEAPVRRYHAHGEIDRLRRRVGDEGPDCLVGDHFPAIDEDRCTREPRRPRRELRAALSAIPDLRPVPKLDRHHCTRRRRKPDEYSTNITMAITISTIAAAQSNS